MQPIPDSDGRPAATNSEVQRPLAPRRADPLLERRKRQMQVADACLKEASKHEDPLRGIVAVVSDILLRRLIEVHSLGETILNDPRYSADRVPLVAPVVAMETRITDQLHRYLQVEQHERTREALLKARSATAPLPPSGE